MKRKVIATIVILWAAGALVLGVGAALAEGGRQCVQLNATGSKTEELLGGPPCVNRIASSKPPWFLGLVSWTVIALVALGLALLWTGGRRAVDRTVGPT